MMRAIGSACGKTILFGEHAVVYGIPAIAIPVKSVSYTVEIEKHSEFFLDFPEIKEYNSIKSSILKILDKLNICDSNIKVKPIPKIPIYSGLGSSASFSVATTRAISKYYNKNLSINQVIEASIEAENVFHGTSSGLDPTVIAYEKPVYYVKGQQPTIIEPKQFSFLVANIGIRSNTGEVVEEVRQAYNKNPKQYDALFQKIGSISRKAMTAIQDGNILVLGKLMNDNQEILNKLGVSLPEIDSMIEQAKDLGAIGAKISGAGKGGNIIILSDNPDYIKEKLNSSNIIEANL